MPSVGMWEPRVVREPRSPCAEPASIFTGTGQAIEARLLNRSANGFCAQAQAPVRIGSWIVLQTVATGSHVAQVRWALGPKFGGAFKLRSADEAAGADGS